MLIEQKSMSERRVTRSVSTEHQTRLAAQSQLSNPPFHSNHNGYMKGLSGLINDAENSMKDPQYAVLRNTSEEMLIRSLVEGIPAPNMEGIGFTNLQQNIRVDSEELFQSWMSLGAGQSAGQLQVHHNPRQSSCRGSNEFALRLSQQTNESFNRVDSFDQFLHTNNFFLEDPAGENKSRYTEGGACANESSPLKWFSQNRPMTRSCSSELRRRYAAMQGCSPPLTEHAMKQTTTITENLANRRFHHQPFLPQVHQSSPSPVYGPLGGESISSFVTLLKGTLERKKMGKGTQQQQRWQQSASESCHSQKLYENLQSRVEGSQNQVSNSFQQNGLRQMQYEGLEQVQNSRQIQSEGPVPHIGASSNGNNQNQPELHSHAPSPSESSVGAPVLSAGEDPCNSGQTTSLKRPARNIIDVDQQPKRQNSISTNPNTDNGELTRDILQMGDQKKSSTLARVGSITSSGGAGIVLAKEDPTKKRRVERQRKMAEAKGRSAVPMMPSDLQATVKRCDTLEKEVRSLKLNLSFMNRKDSEQTKQIEELQKQNEDLQDEKERLLDEIEALATARARLA